MGFDIKVLRYDVGKCTHCGKPIKGTIQDCEYSGGRVWKEYLEKIGYYVPYEMTLTSEQAKDLATFAREHYLYNWASIVALVDRAIESGSFVVINANW